jgi:hypothetical protein
MIPEWLQSFLYFFFVVSLGLLVLSIENFKRLKKKYYALRNYWLTHEHPDIVIWPGQGEGEYYVASVENGQKLVSFFEGRGEARFFYTNARKNGLPAHCSRVPANHGSLKDDVPIFPSSEKT